jgi:hypothetical protein
LGRSGELFAVRDSEMFDLESASLARVKQAVPSLVLVAVIHPRSLDLVAAALRRLDHNDACEVLVPAALEVLARPSATAEDFGVIADLAQAAFPPLLSVLHEVALNSYDPSTRAFEDLLAKRIPGRALARRRKPGPANRWDELWRTASKAASRQDVVLVIEALADTLEFLLGSPAEIHEWRNRDVDAFLDNIGDPMTDPWLAWRWVAPMDADLHGLLVYLADWYAREPCIPDAPALWHRLAVAFSSAVY